MKVLLVALNSKFIHSSLSLRYLREYCKNKKINIDIVEYTINEPIDKIILDISKKTFDVIGFSCYIWNIDMILKICSSIKKTIPESKVILGGPEVSYDCQDIMMKNKFVDFIVYGEGEESLNELLDSLYNNKDVEDIKSICYRKNDKVSINKTRGLIHNLDSIPLPYNNYDVKDLKGKIIYYETTRGCPFNCSYCLSSTIKGVRHFSLQRIKKDLLYLIKNKVKQIKFVDRTFNLDSNRALEIFKFLSANCEGTSFHFEIAGDILNQEIIDFLENVPKGIFQFEIGIQTTNKHVLCNINRKTDLVKLKQNIKKIRQNENVHIHLDLIAGLPGEDYNSIVNSFNQVYSLNPHLLQLGFLKLLKGSKVRTEQDKYNYIFNEFTPYEVLSNDTLSHNQLIEFKEVEDILEKYHNSQSFNNSLEFIILTFYDNSYLFFRELSEYFESKSYNKRSHSKKDLFKILLLFYKQRFDSKFNIFREYLKLDYILEFKNVNLPIWFEDEYEKEKSFEFLKNSDNIKKYIPSYLGEPAKKIIKKVGFKVLNIDVFNKNLTKTAILFDFNNDKYYDVTESWIN